MADAKRYATAAALLLLGGALAGCVETTQEKNARATLLSTRLLASRSAVKVTRPDPQVSVVKVRMLRAPAGTAVAVTLHNNRSHALSDLPISVGVKTRAGHALYLNGQPELPYFQTHIAGVAPRADATWVFTTARRAPRGSAFARVGAAGIPVDTHVTSLPAIAASATGSHRAGRGRAVVSALIKNRSDVGQSDLQVYAFALAGERLLAAGSASIKSLSAGGGDGVQIPLIGDPHAGAVQLQAPPTNLR